MFASRMRTIWAIRHGERLDQIDNDWTRTLYESHGITKSIDDPPLSRKGLVQANEVGEYLKNTEIHHIFSSPFERCVNTAQLIANKIESKIPINVEQGICEALYLCQNPPGWPSITELRARFPNVDSDYEPICKMLKKESGEDHGCLPRVKETVQGILSKYKGNILLIGHGASIGAIHQTLNARWKYVGLCTISKFNYDEKSGEISCELSGDSSHLSDRTNLRAY